ncbi:heavy metal-associated isoprenylated plant protein 39-like isoform X2 [Wolffia australiana]
MAEKIVVKVDVADDDEKRKAMMAVSVLPGINFMCMDMKDKKMTVIGTVDPVKVVDKLRKRWNAHVISVGPKEEPKKTEAKKEEPKKDSAEHIGQLVKLYQAYNPRLTTHYSVISREEDPNSCVIC